MYAKDSQLSPTGGSPGWQQALERVTANVGRAAERAPPIAKGHVALFALLLVVFAFSNAADKTTAQSGAAASQCGLAHVVANADVTFNGYFVTRATGADGDSDACSIPGAIPGAAPGCQASGPILAKAG